MHRIATERLNDLERITPGPQRVGGIRVVHLKKRFAHGAVLEDISLDVPPGSLLSILGESGTGKTTLIRAVAGLCPIDAGTIEIGGREVAGPSGDLPPEERRCGVVFQDLALWPHMKAWENVAFPLEGTLSRADREREARKTLRRVRLREGHDRRPQEISGGERRRVALARALVGKPELLLLDEPFSDLQRSLRDELMMLLWDYAREREVAVVHVTHIQEEALAFADRLGILHGGRIIQEGAPREVYRHPATVEAARLLGEVGLLAARRIGPTTVRSVLGDLTVPEGEGDLLLGLRPEAITTGGVGTVRGTVLQQRFLGGRTLCQVDLGGESIWVTGGREERVGEAVSLVVDADRIHCFPRNEETP